jgi:hypothetical protein
MRAELPFLGLMSLVAIAFPVSDAHAYLDPGTGSFILQMLLGGIAGMAVVGKLYWTKLKLALSRALSGKSASDDAENH